jgi:hypothetical protein
MNRSGLLLIFIIHILIVTCSSGECPASIGLHVLYASQEDTLSDDQFFYNGRIWRNYYSMVEEDQFLFSRDFLPGTVIMRGRTYPDVMILYDIYKDEILTPYEPVGILQLNKEMVDSFSIIFRNKKYSFARMQDSIASGLNGYCNVIYDGRTKLIVKYLKKIEKLEAKGENDKFYQLTRIYLVKDAIIYPVTGKNDLIKVYREDKKAIRDFIKKNNLMISKDNPESFIPVLVFTDSLRK